MSTSVNPFAQFAELRAALSSTTSTMRPSALADTMNATYKVSWLQTSENPVEKFCRSVHLLNVLDAQSRARGKQDSYFDDVVEAASNRLRDPDDDEPGPNAHTIALVKNVMASEAESLANEVSNGKIAWKELKLDLGQLDKLLESKIEKKKLESWTITDPGSVDPQDVESFWKQEPGKQGLAWTIISLAEPFINALLVPNNLEEMLQRETDESKTGQLRIRPDWEWTDPKYTKSVVLDTLQADTQSFRHTTRMMKQKLDDWKTSESTESLDEANVLGIKALAYLGSIVEAIDNKEGITLYGPENIMTQIKNQQSEVSTALEAFRSATTDPMRCTELLTGYQKLHYASEQMKKLQPTPASRTATPGSSRRGSID